MYIVLQILAIIWPAPWAGKMNQILRCDWLPEQARWSYFARLRLLATSRKKNFPESYIINPLLTKLVWSRWLDIGLILFWQKKELGQYPAILMSHLVNNPYVFTSPRKFSKHQFSGLMRSFTKYTASTERYKLL